MQTSEASSRQAFEPLLLEDGYTLKICDSSDDLHSLYQAFLDAIADSTYRDMPLQEEGLEAALVGLTSGNIREQILVGLFKSESEEAKRPNCVGLICGRKGSHVALMQTTPIAAEVLWWVHKDHRGKHSLKLLDAFEYWANLIQAEYISMSSQANEYQQALSRVFSKRGYKKVEEHWMKRLERNE